MEVSDAPLVTEVSALHAAPSATDKISIVSKHVVCTMLDMNSLLLPTLCEVVSAASDIEPDIERQLRKQRVAALKARWANRPFTGLSWLDEVSGSILESSPSESEASTLTCPRTGIFR